MNYPLEEIIDKWASISIKVENGVTAKLEQEMARLNTAMSEFHHPSTPAWASEMVSVHRKLREHWRTIAHNRNRPAEIVSVGREALAILELNIKRQQVKDRIAVATGGFFEK